LAFFVALVLVLPVPFLAQASTEKSLTNADIGRMVKAGIPESIILREIQMSKADLSTSAAALIELKNEGASGRILDAVLDSRLATNKPRSEPPPPPYLQAQSATPGLHHLPAFEAEMRFDANTKDKIKVSKDHIRVERSGVPLFSLKWKENTRDK
jgi:hypothetical protein